MEPRSTTLIYPNRTSSCRENGCSDSQEKPNDSLRIPKIIIQKAEEGGPKRLGRVEMPFLLKLNLPLVRLADGQLSKDVTLLRANSQADRFNAVRMARPQERSLGRER